MTSIRRFATTSERRQLSRLGQHLHAPSAHRVSCRVFPPSPASPSQPLSLHSPTSQSSAPRSHLRDVLGAATYESFARTGETMTTAEMSTYTYDQIDQARAELKAVSK